MYVLSYRSFARSFLDSFVLARTTVLYRPSFCTTFSGRHFVLFSLITFSVVFCLLFVVVFCYWCFVYHSFVRSNCTANVLLCLLCWTVSYRQIVQLVSVRLFAPPFLTVFLYCEYLSVQSFCTISMCLV